MGIGKIGNDYNSNFYQNGSGSKNIEKNENVKDIYAIINGSEVAGSSNDMLSKLQKKYPNLSLASGSGINWKGNNKSNNVIIHPDIIEKMENDATMAKEYTQRLADIEASFKFGDAIAASNGGTVTYRCTYIDENGKLWGGGIVEFKDSQNEKLRKEAEENMHKRIEKNRALSKEKTRKIEEKMAKALKDGNGRVEFNNKEMQTMIQVAKRIGFNAKVDIKL